MLEKTKCWYIGSTDVPVKNADLNLDDALEFEIPVHRVENLKCPDSNQSAFLTGTSAEPIYQHFVFSL